MRPYINNAEIALISSLIASNIDKLSAIDTFTANNLLTKLSGDTEQAKLTSNYNKAASKLEQLDMITKTKNSLDQIDWDKVENELGL